MYNTGTLPGVGIMSHSQEPLTLSKLPSSSLEPSLLSSSQTTSAIEINKVHQTDKLKRLFHTNSRSSSLLRLCLTASRPAVQPRGFPLVETNRERTRTKTRCPARTPPFPLQNWAEDTQAFKPLTKEHCVWRCKQMDQI